MTPKFFITIGAIFLVGILMLYGTHCAYSKLDEFQTMDTVMQENIESFPDVDHISTDTLATLLESGGLLLVDTREPEEFAVSRIPGAVNISNVSDLKEAVANLETKPRVIALYCSVGYRSSRLSKKATSAGLINVKNVNGSIFQWANEGRELEGGKKVHPFNEFWGRLLDEGKRAELH